jgi:magnesium transporter
MVQRYAFRSRRRPAIGARPGELALPAEQTPRRIHVIHYTAERIEELDVDGVEDLARFRAGPGTTWIEVEGLGDEAGLRRLGELFGIHPLALADVVNVPQRPKTDAYDGHDLVIAWMALLGAESECHLEQVSFVIGPSWVISFQEEREDVFDPVRARLRGGALIRSLGADHLAYALIDNLVDGYYPVIEAVGEELEELEEETVQRPTRATLARIHTTRRLILTLARSMRQHRDALNLLARDESPRLSPGARIYFRDVYDHAVQINEVLESYREIAVSLMEVYLSSVSNRMNEVMKVLTVIATIFIPLTFLVGVYGMNFDYMPELHVRWAYPLLWVLMIAVAIAMYAAFRRRGWVGREPDEGDGGAGDP